MNGTWIKLLVASAALASVGAVAYLQISDRVSTSRAYLGANILQLKSSVPAAEIIQIASTNHEVSKGQIIWTTDPSIAHHQAEKTKLSIASVRAKRLEKEQRLSDPVLASLSPLDPSDASIETAQLGVLEESLKLDYQQHLAVLDQHTRRSPVDGIIVSVLKSPGETLLPHEHVMTIVDTSHFWVDAYFKESDILKISLGQQAVVTLDSHPSKRFNATVVGVSPAAGTKVNAASPNYTSSTFTRVTQRVPVRLTLNNPPPIHEMKPGVSATVRIVTHND